MVASSPRHSWRGGLRLTTVEFHPKAIAEARAAREWYASRNNPAADAFIEEIDRGVRHIAAAPTRWPTYLHGTRRYLLRRFPFSLVYRQLGSVVTIVAVAHAKRRPGYWRDQ